MLLFDVAQRTIRHRIRTFQYPESTVFRVVTPCSSDRAQGFGRKYRFHLQSWRLNTARNQLNLRSASAGLLLCLPFETGSDALLWNVGLSAKYVEVQSGRLYPSQLPVCEPGIQPSLPILPAGDLSGDAFKLFTPPGLDLRSLCCPACRQSLYRLRYRGSFLVPVPTSKSWVFLIFRLFVPYITPPSFQPNIFTLLYILQFNVLLYLYSYTITTPTQSFSCNVRSLFYNPILFANSANCVKICIHVYSGM
jgi:hypothetical protein